MMAAALAPYESSLSSASALRMLAADGSAIVLDIERYLDECDLADESVLRRCRGPVIDLGCGPGRIAGTLAARGIQALGVDFAGTAVALTRHRGVPAVRRDLFEPLPGEGGWQTAVLLDGNVGIGGDVDRLLHRLRALMAPGGRLVIETASHAHADESKRLCFADDAMTLGPSFPWAVAGIVTVVAKAERAGWAEADRWECGQRSFVEVAVV